MLVNGEFVKLIGYLISVIFQLGLYCTLGSNLMNQVNVKRLLLFIMVSCSLLSVDLSKERLIIPLASFYAFIILFTPLSFHFYFLIFFPFIIWLLFTGCKAVGKSSDRAYWVIKVIIRLFHDTLHNVVFTKRRKQWKNKWLRISKQMIETYFKFISLQSTVKTMEHKGSVQWG